MLFCHEATRFISQMFIGTSSEFLCITSYSIVLVLAMKRWDRRLCDFEEECRMIQSFNCNKFECKHPCLESREL